MLSPGNNSFFHLNALTAGTLIKTGYGLLNGVQVNSHGTAANLLTIYDGISTGGNVIAVIDTTVQDSFLYNVAFNTGLFIVSAAGTAGDITISYQ